PPPLLSATTSAEGAEGSPDVCAPSNAPPPPPPPPPPAPDIPPPPPIPKAVPDAKRIGTGMNVASWSDQAEGASGASPALPPGSPDVPGSAFRSAARARRSVSDARSVQCQSRAQFWTTASEDDDVESTADACDAAWRSPATACGRTG